MEIEQLEQLAGEIAEKLSHNEAQWDVARDAFLFGYRAAQEKLQQQIYFLESQLRQANGTIMRLEAER